MTTRTFNLPRAPHIQPEEVIVDLGQYSQKYTGWKVVVNPMIPLSINDLLAKMTATSGSEISIPERLAAMEEWICTAFLAWNLQDVDGNDLPQPQEGGAKMCPYILLEPLSKAFAEALKPSDPS